VQDADKAMGGGERPQDLRAILEIGNVEVLLGPHPYEREGRERPAAAEFGPDMRVIEDRVLMQRIEAYTLAK
jgi:hypothetical protein